MACLGIENESGTVSNSQGLSYVVQAERKKLFTGIYMYLLLINTYTNKINELISFSYMQSGSDSNILFLMAFPMLHPHE